MVSNNVILHLGMLYTDGITYGTLDSIEREGTDNPYVVIKTIGGKIPVAYTIFYERWRIVTETKKQS